MVKYVHNDSGGAGTERENTEQRMGVEEFKDLILCCGNIYLWKFDSNGNLLQSNCPDEAVWGTAFELLGCKQRIHHSVCIHRQPCAAVEGELSREETYGLGDSYIQMMEPIEPHSNLESLAMSMYDSFVRRVHNSRINLI